MISVYRLSSSRFPANSGAGAALFGGRWNRVGTPAIYAAESRALAALEVLVHFAVLPRDFMLTEIQIPEDLGIYVLEAVDLPDGWDAEPVSPVTQEIGDIMLLPGRDNIAVLSVPSSIIPAERNFVINPGADAFHKIRFSRSVPFQFDPRLK